MAGAPSKRLTLTAMALGAGAALIGSTQTWYDIGLQPGAASVDTLPVTGQQLSAALSSLAVAGLALTVALTIAGRIFRAVLGVLAAVLGGAIALLSWQVTAEPAQAAAGSLTELTGLAVGPTLLGLITGVTPTPWPWVSAGAGALLALAGLVALFASGRWGSAGRRYETQPSAAAAPDAGPDRISEWDRISEGEDPTDAAPGDGSRSEPPTR